MKKITTVLILALFCATAKSQTQAQINAQVEARLKSLEGKQATDDATGTFIKTKYFLVVKKPGGIDTIDLNMAALLKFMIDSLPAQPVVDIKPLQDKLENFITLQDGYNKTFIGNDQTLSQRITDSAKAQRQSLRLTDSAALALNTAIRVYNRQTRERIDSIVVNMKPIVPEPVDLSVIIQDIKNIQNSDKKRDDRILSMEVWADKMKKYIFAPIPQ